MTDPSRPRVLALCSRFYLDQLDHLAVLAQHCPLQIAYNAEREPGAVSQARREGLEIECIGSIGLAKMQARLRRVVEQFRPEVIYSLWDTNEDLTLLAREVAPQDCVVVHKCSDPLTTLLGRRTSAPGAQPEQLEARALRASDGQVFCTKAIQTYLEQNHQLDLSAHSIIVPHARSEATLSSASAKLSAVDGRVHIALVGFAHPNPRHGRCYLRIIRRLCSAGFVVHSHFHEVRGVSNDVYRELARELDDYHAHETLPNRKGTELSQTISQYDLMGVFHELDAEQLNEAAVLEVCMPSKAICGWVNGAIPVVCHASYRGVVEFIDAWGIGFAIDDWSQLESLARNRSAIEAAGEACARVRQRFTHEWHAPRIVSLFKSLLTARRHVLDGQPGFGRDGS